MVLLKKGMKDPAVKFLREMLWDFGCIGPDSSFWISPEAIAAGIHGPDDPAAKSFWVTDFFDYYCKNAVTYFQQTHENVNHPGKPLEDDGIVGPDTWKTIELCAKGLEPQPDVTVEKTAVTKEMQMGDKIIFTWNKYVGEKEKPKGSNRSSVIDRFTHFVGKPSKIKGPAWCDASASFIEQEATGGYTLKYLWRCYDTMQYAKAKGLWIPVGDVRSGKHDIRPGVRWIMQYGGGKGHTGHVAFVVRDDFGKPIKFYTREGNYNDSVGISLRDISQGTLAGFCDFLPVEDKSVGEKGRNIKVDVNGKTT
jgi:hypothetical protein